MNQNDASKFVCCSYSKENLSCSSSAQGKSREYETFLYLLPIGGEGVSPDQKNTETMHIFAISLIHPVSRRIST